MWYVSLAAVKSANKYLGTHMNAKWGKLFWFSLQDSVGLLIGRQGRNIKQLKQDSGADIFVHEAVARKDIQIVQILGKYFYIT